MPITTRVPLGLLAAAFVAVPAAAGDMRCVDRDGRCMAVTVNGQKAVKLDKATKKLLAGLQAGRGSEMRHNLSQTRYYVAAPVNGELDVKADRSADSKDWFGENRQFEVMVVPLSDVKLEARQQVGTARGVSTEGGTPLTLETVLESKRLPPGPYLLVVSLNGDSNWDRMTLYVQVAE